MLESSSAVKAPDVAVVSSKFASAAGRRGLTLLILTHFAANQHARIIAKGARNPVPRPAP